jgi:hypothetical protein
VAAATPDAPDAAAADGEQPPGPGRLTAARARLLWAGALVLAAVALFWCYLFQSRTTAVNSDAAGMVLQGWDMMHGNAALHGWFVADVSFYTFEIPIDGLVAVIHGLGPDVAHITAAIVYTLLVLSAALLARGRAKGREGVVRAVLAAGILVAPGYNPGTHVLLLAPDHTGIGVPILLALLFADRARERWWGAAGTGLLLVWAQLDDPLARYAAAAPLALVCLVRAALPLLRRQQDGRRRPGWYDAGLAAAAVVSVGLTDLVIRGIRAAGGYQMRALALQQHVPVSAWAEQVKLTVQNVLILFGADFFEQPTAIRTAIAVLHLAGFLLALAGLLAGIASLFRAADRITQVLTVGTLVVLVAGAFATHMLLLQGAHEIAVVLPFGAVLAGRTIGPWLARRRLPRLALTPVLAAALAGYLAALGWAAAQPKQQAETQQLAGGPPPDRRPRQVLGGGQHHAVQRRPGPRRPHGRPRETAVHVGREGQLVRPRRLPGDVRRRHPGIRGQRVRLSRSGRPARLRQARARVPRRPVHNHGLGQESAAPGKQAGAGVNGMVLWCSGPAVTP